ncbi:hypothetical protein [Bowmanella yangjiangensis]|uniref:Uncharacterized protein n=1 Tax=Bowmanella yangjiangensis TaxID=2811230 RepID=A0ABS3CSE0_9ALTE|nr:hypothetical protein [Bowmanella yangjiangensis]MBN7819326.1 hypothetical protein [Bowmanella yangjiangensis]
MNNKITFVINSCDPYQLEVVNILSLPEGSRFRLRYVDRWIDSNSVSDSSLQIGMDGYIIFHHSNKFPPHEGESESIYSNFYPIRKIKLSSYEIIGNIYYFECELCDYFDYPKSDYISSSELIRINTTLQTEKLVLIDTEDRSLINREAHNTKIDSGNKKWLRTVNALAEIPPFKDMDFYRISRISEAKDFNTENIVPKNGVFDLKETESYEILITQFRKNAEFDINKYPKKRGVYLSGSKEISPSKEFAMAMGKYDVLRLGFSVGHVNYSTKTSININYSVSQDIDGKCDNLFSLPVILRRKKKPILKKIILSILFATLYFLPGFISLISSTVVSQNLSDFIKDFSIICFTVSLVDSIAVYRKNNER